MVPMRASVVVHAGIHPVVQQLIVSVSIAASSLLVLAVESAPVLSAWGLVGAAMWSIGNICAIYAVRSLQLGVAQALWSGGIAIVSFCWGVFAPVLWSNATERCELTNTAGALSGLALLVLGIAAVVMTSSRQSVRDSAAPGADALASDAPSPHAVRAERLNDHGTSRSPLLSAAGSMSGGATTYGAHRRSDSAQVVPLSPDAAPAGERTAEEASATPVYRFEVDSSLDDAAYAALGEIESAQAELRAREARALAIGSSLTPAEFACRRAVGLLQALGAALLIGSHLVPLKLATRALSDAESVGPTLPRVAGYALSFGIGAVVSSFVLLCALLLLRIVHSQLVLNFGYTGCLATAQRNAQPLYSRAPYQRVHLNVTLLCLASGLLWNVGR